MAATRPSSEEKQGIEKDERILEEEREEHHEEKVIQVGNIRVLGLDSDDADFYLSYPPEKRKKLVRKVDIRLVPMLAVLYLISHLDRANIGNAKIEGLVTDLNLSGVQYNIALSIFFVPYILFEIPSNIVLKRFKRPSAYLGSLIMIWGTVMTLTGVVQNAAGLMATRFLLGVFEAGFFPGAVYLCTHWYMPNELQTRIASFYFASALSGAFSGILAAGIAQMRGLGGYEGWRWIFILEGIATVVLGVACFFFLIDSPALSTRWLQPDEIRYLELQSFIKQGGKFSENKPSRPQWKHVKSVLLDWRIYMQSYTLVCIAATSYGLKFTLPTITKSMGYANTQAQLMSAPPYIAGAISALCFARLSDHFYWRMPFLAIPLTLIAVGYSIIISFHGQLEENIGATYFALVLVCIGLYPVQPAGNAWCANNLAPASRRAVGIGLNVCLGNVGGIIGSFMYIETEAPKYYTGFGLSLAFGATGLLNVLALETIYWYGNKKKGKISEEEAKAKYTEDELLDMGDKSPLFKYTL